MIPGLGGFNTVKFDYVADRSICDMSMYGNQAAFDGKSPSRIR